MLSLVWARALFACVFIVGCDVPRLDLGDECARASDCKEPFVCRDARCRIECRESRDCEPGAACVLDGMGLGSCLFAEEADCQIPSDCPPQLDCIMGHCRNVCEADRDCPEGTCTTDALGRRACSTLDGGIADAGVAAVCTPACSLDLRCCDGTCVERTVSSGVDGRESASFQHCGGCDQPCDPLRADGCRRLSSSDPAFCTCGTGNACGDAEVCAPLDGGMGCAPP